VLLGKLAAHLPLKITKPDYNSIATKVNVLLQVRGEFCFSFF
jgi:hypothetical protein